MTSQPTLENAVDLTRVSAWLRANGLGDGLIEDPQLLMGGTQNVLLRLRVDGRDLVLRRPPLRPRPRNNELILREAAVLKALGGTAVPHPRFVAVCEDTAVLGSAVFFLMEAVDGFNPADGMPSGWSSGKSVEQLVYRATDALADIGALDYEDLGLTDLGRSADFLERQVPRWIRERESYLGIDGYDGAPLPGFDMIRDYLAANVPAAFTPGLMHGDYHFGNLLFDCQSAQLNAVLDWEMSTVGDPLLDLGRYLALLPDQHEVVIDSGGIWKARELPPAAAIVARYTARSGRPVDHLSWYVAMGCFKLGIILEGTYARSRAGLAPEPIGAQLHDTAFRLFKRARRIVETQ